jgi:hypothetical protein
MGWVVKATLRPPYPGKDPVPIVQETGWAPGPVSMCAKNIVPTNRITDLKCMLLSSIYYVTQQLHDIHVGVTSANTFIWIISVCISRTLSGIVISGHGNGKDNTRDNVLITRSIYALLARNVHNKVSSVNINKTHKHLSCIRTLALFLPGPTISVAGYVLAISMYPVSQSTLPLEDLTCIAKYSVRRYQIVGRISDRPGALDRDIRHTLISPDITVMFHRTYP